MFTLIKRREGGWNAFYRGRRMLIQASEAQDEEQARQLAIRFFGIPRRSQSAVTVTPTFLEAAQSPEQQRFFGLVLAYKKGEITKSEVSDDVVTAADNMTLDQIKKYAGTKHSEINERINKNMNAFKKLVLEKINSKIQNEKNEYQKLFKKKLDDEGKDIPDMSDKEKKDFFTKVSDEWSKIKDKVDESEYKTSAEQKLSEKKKKYSEISKDELDELFNELALEYSDLDEALRISPADNKVIISFTEQKPEESKQLKTDGKTLDGLWMGGNNIAQWKSNKIHFNDLGSKAAQTVQKAIKREAPKNQIVESKTFTGKEIADKMRKEPEAFGGRNLINRVAQMKTVTAKELDDMLPDYVAGKDIQQLFEQNLDEMMFKKGQAVKDFEGNVGEIINISSDKSTIDVKLNTGETVSYNTVELSVFRESQVDEEIAGWIAIFKGKRLEIDKSEAKDLYGAKQLAIKKLNVPKSQTGLLAIAPAYNENTIQEKSEPAGWIVVYAGKRIEIKKSKFVDSEKKARDQAINQLNIPKNAINRIQIKPFFDEATVKTGKTFNETFYSIEASSSAEYKPAEVDSSYVDSTNRWIDKLYNSEKDKAEPRAAGEKGFKSFHDLVVDIIDNPSAQITEL